MSTGTSLPKSILPPKLAAEPELQPLALSEPLVSRYVWESPIRIGHWMMALSIPVLLATGFFIAWPFASVQGEATGNFLMGRVRQIHFIAAYVLLASFVLRLYWFFAGNNYARSGFPFIWRASWWRHVISQGIEYLTLRITQGFVGHNQLGALTYLIFIAGMGGAEIATGFAMYGETNPGGFWSSTFGWVIRLCGGSYQVHQWHHFFAWGILLFIALHIYIVILDSICLDNGMVGSIFTGRKYIRKSDVDSNTWLS
jgi:Ni/Fe-hydrogenase 1 B-type cytochrome subunit